MYAGFWKRFVAVFVDGIILTAFLFGAAIVLSVILGGSEPGQTIGSFAILAAIFLYNPVFESSSWQATPGKKVMGIKVTDMAGNPVSFWRAVARNLCKVFSNILYIGYIMAGITEKKQGLHDMMAGCLVVDNNYSPELSHTYTGNNSSKAAVIIGAVVAVFFVGIFIMGILAAIALPQYKKAVTKARLTEGLITINTITAIQKQEKAAGRAYITDWNLMPIANPSGTQVSSGGTTAKGDKLTYFLSRNAAVLLYTENAGSIAVVKNYNTDKMTCFFETERFRGICNTIGVEGQYDPQIRQKFSK
ncbi:putative membrane protein YckC [Parelusimicrobium proximum]|uniref:RDD family protein n=1 Tax=Parelusimicrobium proximum TaxID=3228953 RepID=UPI003D17478E